MSKKTLSALALISALGLAGCSTDTTQPSESVSEAPVASQTPSESPTQEVITLDEPFYVKTPVGSEITVDFNATAPAGVEEYREASGVEPVGYAHVEIDNREGTEFSSVYEVTLYDEEGNAFSYNTLDVSDWGATMYEDYSYGLPNGTVVDEETASQLDKMELGLQDINSSPGADPLQVSETWLVGPAIPEDITGVSIEANGSGESVSMVPLSKKDSFNVEVPETVKEDDPSTWQGTTPEGNDFAVVGPPPAEAFTGPTTYDEWVVQGSVCTDEAVANLSEDDYMDAAWDCA